MKPIEDIDISKMQDLMDRMSAGRDPVAMWVLPKGSVDRWLNEHADAVVENRPRLTNSLFGVPFMESDLVEAPFPIPRSWIEMWDGSTGFGGILSAAVKRFGRERLLAGDSGDSGNGS